MNLPNGSNVIQLLNDQTRIALDNAKSILCNNDF